MEQESVVESMISECLIVAASSFFGALVGTFTFVALLSFFGKE